MVNVVFEPQSTAQAAPIAPFREAVAEKSRATLVMVDLVLTCQHRSTRRKPLRRDPRTEPRQRMHEIVRTRIRYGYRRVHILLKREGWGAGRNLVYRLYREEGVALKAKRPRRRKMAAHREERTAVTRANQAWAIDFVHDQLVNGQTFRALTVLDIYTRETLAIEVGLRLRGEHVVDVLNRLVRRRKAPERLLADNGIQFTNRACVTYDFHHIFDRVCDENGIEQRLTKIKHPWTNGWVERINRTIKDATVKRFHYDSHEQLRRHLQDFIHAYNFGRRLKTLKGLTPYEFICKRWTSEPDRFIVDPIHQMPTLNT